MNSRITALVPEHIAKAIKAKMAAEKGVGGGGREGVVRNYNGGENVRYSTASFSIIYS